MKRVFLGIPLSSEIISNVTPLFRELNETEGEFTFVSLENLHFTVKFLGDVDEKNLELIKEKVQTVVSCVSSFSIKVESVGVFPSLERMSVVWIGSESRELISLMKEVNIALRSVHQEDYDTITPHATLARVKSGLNKLKIRQFVERHQKDSFGLMLVDTVVLYESTLTPMGSVYTVLEKFRLR